MNERYGTGSVSDPGATQRANYWSSGRLRSPYRTASTVYLTSPATHEMNDLEPVARSQFGLGPFRARQD